MVSDHGSQRDRYSRFALSSANRGAASSTVGDRRVISSSTLFVVTTPLPLGAPPSTPNVLTRMSCGDDRFAVLDATGAHLIGSITDSNRRVLAALPLSRDPILLPAGRAHTGEAQDVISRCQPECCRRGMANFGGHPWSLAQRRQAARKAIYCQQSGEYRTRLACHRGVRQ